MTIKNIRVKFDLVGELLGSESLTYLRIKDQYGTEFWGVIDDYREVDHLDETIEQFRERVLVAYEVSNALYEIKKQEELEPWEKSEDWWKK